MSVLVGNDEEHYLKAGAELIRRLSDCPHPRSALTFRFRRYLVDYLGKYLGRQSSQDNDWMKTKNYIERFVFNFEKLVRERRHRQKVSSCSPHAIRNRSIIACFVDHGVIQTMEQ